MSTNRSRREEMDRVFFNTLLLLKGVVLAYGATVLIALIRTAAPWDSWGSSAVYVAWVATTFFVALTLVSQALGSSQAVLRPTTLVVLLTLAINMSETVGFALLEPRDAAIHAVNPWFLAMAAEAGLCCAFVTLVLSRDRSKRYPETKLGQLRVLVEADRRAAAVTALLALLAWPITRLPTSQALACLYALVLGGIALYALHDQRKKVDGSSPSSDFGLAA